MTTALSWLLLLLQLGLAAVALHSNAPEFTNVSLVMQEAWSWQSAPYVGVKKTPLY